MPLYKLRLTVEHIDRLSGEETLFLFRFVSSCQHRYRHSRRPNANLSGDIRALAAAQVLHSAALNQYSYGATATSAIPSPNASVSMPANNQQCLNDSIIDTERSRGEVTGHSPLGFPHDCLGKGSVSSSDLRGTSEAPC